MVTPSLEGKIEDCMIGRMYFRDYWRERGTEADVYNVTYIGALDQLPNNVR